MRSIIPCALALAGFVAVSSFASDRTGPAAWGDLEAGPYAVGFRSFQEEDRTRGYWPLRDYLGNERKESTARPMQVSLWYPASIAPDAEPLAYRHYAELAELALGEAHRQQVRQAIQGELRSDFFGRYFPPDGPDDADLQRILDQPTAAFADAPFADGTFPVVIHSGFGPLAQSVLLEYLASHGFIVLTTNMLGSDAAWFNRGSGTLEWWQETARDVEWLRAFATRFESADVRRTAVIGMTAPSGVLAQMSSMQISAVVGTEAMYREVLEDADRFDPARVRIPILDIVSKGRTANEDLLEMLGFSDRWIIRYEDVEHTNFYQFGRLTGASGAREQPGYASTARLTRAFLEAHLNQNGSDWSEQLARDLAREPVAVSHLPARDPRPSEAEFLLLVREGKLQEARRGYRAASDQGSPRFFDPNLLRTTAIFRLYDDGDAEGAADALRILLDAYPEDVEAYRFLSRALQALGDDLEARGVLERAVGVIDSLDVTAEERRRLRTRIEQEMARLD